MADEIESIEFERGDKVKHPKWGMGTILYKSGSGERTKVIVLFQEVGQKTLMVKFAKLERVALSQTKAKSKIVYEEPAEETVEETPSDNDGGDEDMAGDDSEDDDEEEDL